MSTGQWSEWEKFVLSELNRMNKSLDQQSHVLINVQSEIVRQKATARAWGAMAGLIFGMLPPSIGFLVDHYLKK